MSKIGHIDWRPCVVETNLNLQKSGFPTLGAKIAEAQLEYQPDIIANVEDRESCSRKGYDDVLKKAEYQRASAIDRDQRGVSCWVKGGLRAEKIFEMEDPHFMHIRVVSQEEAYVDLMILRVLVRRINEEIRDFKERAQAWERVVTYIDTIEDLSHIVLIGDFNHGVPCEDPAWYVGKPRQYYNYQMVTESLQERALAIAHIPGYSKEGADGHKGYSVDHLATGTQVSVENAVFHDPFEGPQKTRKQGIPDHAMIVAKLVVE